MHPARNRVSHAKAASSCHRVYYLSVVAVAFTLRIGAAMMVAKGDANLWFFNQASELGCVAHSVNTGHGLASPFCGETGPSAFLTPGYPLLVALDFHLFGEFTLKSAGVLVGSQILFALLTIVVLMQLSRKLFGAQAANVAGALCAVSPTMIWLPVVFWETSLSILLLTSSLWLALRCSNKPRQAHWAAMGLLCALSMLVNASLSLTLSAIMTWTVLQNRRARLSFRGPLLALVLWGVAFAAWPVRNLIVLHAFIPLRSNLGYELWQGNRPGSNGIFKAELHPNVNRLERTRYVELGEVAYMRDKTRVAIESIKANPSQFLKLSVKRFGRFWVGVTSMSQSAFTIASISFTSLLALAGLLLLAWRRPSDAILLALPLLIFPIPFYITHADFRFRLVLDPIAIMLGTYVLQCWRSHLSAQSVGGVLSATTTIA